MSAHTPGPWHALGRVVTLDEVSLRGLTPIAKCASHREGQLRISLREAEANARLIAAAPELLEALREVSAFLGDKCDWGTLDEGQEFRLWRVAEDALDKVHGGDK